MKIIPIKVYYLKKFLKTEQKSTPTDNKIALERVKDK